MRMEAKMAENCADRINAGDKLALYDFVSGIAGKLFDEAMSVVGDKHIALEAVKRTAGQIKRTAALGSCPVQLEEWAISIVQETSHKLLTQDCGDSEEICEAETETPKQSTKEAEDEGAQDEDGEHVRECDFMPPLLADEDDAEVLDNETKVPKHGKFSDIALTVFLGAIIVVLLWFILVMLIEREFIPNFLGDVVHRFAQWFDGAVFPIFR